MKQHLGGPGPLSLKKLTGLVQDAEAMLKLQARIGRLPEGNFKDNLMEGTFKWFERQNSDIALMVDDPAMSPQTVVEKPPEPDCVDGDEDEFPDFTTYSQGKPKPDPPADN